MTESFESIISVLTEVSEENGSFSPSDFSKDFESDAKNNRDIAQVLNRPFCTPRGQQK